MLRSLSFLPFGTPDPISPGLRWVHTPYQPDGELVKESPARTIDSKEGDCLGYKERPAPGSLFLFGSEPEIKSQADGVSLRATKSHTLAGRTKGEIGPPFGWVSRKISVLQTQSHSLI